MINYWISQLIVQIKSSHSAPRNPRMQIEALTKEATTLLIPHLISSIAPNSYNSLFQNNRWTRKNHREASSFKGHEPNGQEWQSMQSSQHRWTWISLKDRTQINLCSNRETSYYLHKLEYLLPQCMNGILIKFRNRRKGQRELAEESLRPSNKTHTTPR